MAIADVFSRDAIPADCAPDVVVEFIWGMQLKSIETDAIGSKILAA